MIVDTSILVSIILGEAGYQKYVDVITGVMRPRISAFSLYEASTVLLQRRGPQAIEALEAFVRETGLTVESFHLKDVFLAARAYARFGKGISPVGLNMGDCPVYALAELHQEPVLSTSDEFVRAGVPSMLS